MYIKKSRKLCLKIETRFLCPGCAKIRWRALDLGFRKFKMDENKELPVKLLTKEVFGHLHVVQGFSFQNSSLLTWIYNLGNLYFPVS